jgi:hypothetical protein
MYEIILFMQRPVKIENSSSVDSILKEKET